MIDAKVLIAGNVTNVLLALRRDVRAWCAGHTTRLVWYADAAKPLFVNDRNFKPKPLIDADVISIVEYLRRAR